MKTVILAAGKATRLLPLTKDTPHSLLKVGNKTILERQIDALNKSGINDIIIVTGYLADKIEDFCKKENIKSFFNPFHSVSGVLATIWIVKDELKEGFIFLYSDILFEESVIIKLLKNKDDICLATKTNDVREEAEKVREKNQVIIKISKTKFENEANAEFVGIAKFSRDGAKLFIKEMDEIIKNKLDASIIDVIQGIIDKGYKIHSCNISNAKWVDIDFEKDLELAKALFL